MNNPPSEVKYWEQLGMFHPDVVEVTLKIGFVYESQHCQVEIEVVDPESPTLMELASWPHFHIADTEEKMREIGSYLTVMLRKYSGPF